MSDDDSTTRSTYNEGTLWTGPDHPIPNDSCTLCSIFLLAQRYLLALSLCTGYAPVNGQVNHAVSRLVLLDAPRRDKVFAPSNHGGLAVAHHEGGPSTCISPRISPYSAACKPAPLLCRSLCSPALSCRHMRTSGDSPPTSRAHLPLQAPQLLHPVHPSAPTPSPLHCRPSPRCPPSTPDTAPRIPPYSHLHDRTSQDPFSSSWHHPFTPLRRNSLHPFSLPSHHSVTHCIGPFCIPSSRAWHHSSTPL